MKKCMPPYRSSLVVIWEVVPELTVRLPTDECHQGGTVYGNVVICE